MATHCAECKTEIPPASRDGLCPVCLLGLALGNPEKTLPVAVDPRPSLLPADDRFFAHYELLEQIGQGGMGVVYKARQRNLERIVALKLMISGPHATDAEIKRFHAEATAAATLQHPNVVAIHEVGEHEGRHFFTMEFVNGQSLAGIVRRTPLAAERAARYVKIIAEAVQYAHQRGILHRDLKPHNVLLDEHDQPRLTDFGLARRIDIDSHLTISGAVLGTPSYMPPEQAAGKRQEIGPRSDVYSLGAILYDLLTGRPPFRADTPLDTLRQVMDAEPAPPRLLNRKVPRDLETICLKCLAKTPAQRYASAQALADDLKHFLQQEPIQARPMSRLGRGWRWCVRHPRIAGLSGVIGLLFVLLAAAAVLFRQDVLDSNVHSAHLAADTVQARLLAGARVLQSVSTRDELIKSLRDGDTNAMTRFLETTWHEYSPAQEWPRFETWLLLDPAGLRLARWPPQSELRDRSFRDYYRGAVKRFSSNGLEAVHFSRVYQSQDDQLFKFGMSAPVREPNQNVLGVIAAMVGTTSTERDLGLTNAQRKIVLIARGDERPPPDAAGETNKLPDFVIMSHPGFRERDPVVPIAHPNLNKLMADDRIAVGGQFDRDAQYRDPVSARHRQYLGRWLAGFARVPNAPFIVVLQTRDWVSDAMFFTAITAAVLAVTLIFWSWWRKSS